MINTKSLEEARDDTLTGLRRIRTELDSLDIKYSPTDKRPISNISATELLRLVNFIIDLNK